MFLTHLTFHFQLQILNRRVKYVKKHQLNTTYAHSASLQLAEVRSGMMESHRFRDESNLRNHLGRSLIVI